MAVHACWLGPVSALLVEVLHALHSQPTCTLQHIHMHSMCMAQRLRCCMSFTAIHQGAVSARNCTNGRACAACPARCRPRRSKQPRQPSISCRARPACQLAPSWPLPALRVPTRQRPRPASCPRPTPSPSAATLPAWPPADRLCHICSSGCVPEQLLLTASSAGAGALWSPGAWPYRRFGRCSCCC